MRTHRSTTAFHLPTSSLRTALAVAAAGVLLLTACGGTAAPTDATGDPAGACEVGTEDCNDTPDSMNMCAPGVTDCADTAADCEEGTECNDTGTGDPFAACEPGVACGADGGEGASGDCPECDPDAQPVAGGDERMNPSITIVQAFVGEVRAVEQAPGTITSPMQMFLQEAMVDGNQVTVSFNGGEAPCFVVDHVDVTEEEDRVFITVWAGQADGASDCGNMEMSLQTVTVVLDAELGSRLLLDGSRMHPADNV